MGKLKHEDILQDPDFKDLSRQKFAISIILTILELVLYFGFIGLIAFNKPFLAKKLSEGGATTIGIPIAVGTILGSWVLTGIYIQWANSKYDKLVDNPLVSHKNNTFLAGDAYGSGSLPDCLFCIFYLKEPAVRRKHCYCSVITH